MDVVSRIFIGFTGIILFLASGLFGGKLSTDFSMGMRARDLSTVLQEWKYSLLMLNSVILIFASVVPQSFFSRSAFIKWGCIVAVIVAEIYIASIVWGSSRGFVSAYNSLSAGRESFPDLTSQLIVERAVMAVCGTALGIMLAASATRLLRTRAMSGDCTDA